MNNMKNAEIQNKSEESDYCLYLQTFLHIHKCVYGFEETMHSNEIICV